MCVRSPTVPGAGQGLFIYRHCPTTAAREYYMHSGILPVEEIILGLNERRPKGGT